MVLESTFAEFYLSFLNLNLAYITPMHCENQSGYLHSCLGLCILIIDFLLNLFLTFTCLY